MRKRGGRQTPVIDEQILWFNASGYPLLTLTSNSPLSFAYTISAQGNRYFSLTYDSNNATYPPTLTATVLGSGTPEWSSQLDDLFANLDLPISVPAADVLVISGWSPSNYSFAGVNASSGQLLWWASTFFFTPRDETSFLFAVTPTDSVVYVSEVTATGALSLRPARPSCRMPRSELILTFFCATQVSKSAPSPLTSSWATSLPSGASQIPR